MRERVFSVLGYNHERYLTETAPDGRIEGVTLRPALTYRVNVVVTAQSTRNTLFVSGVVRTDIGQAYRAAAFISLAIFQSRLALNSDPLSVAAAMNQEVEVLLVHVFAAISPLGH